MSSPVPPPAPKNIQDTIQIFDRRAYGLHRRRTLKKFSEHDFLFSWAEAQLLERLDDIKRNFPLAVQLGGRRTENFDQALKERAGTQHLVTMDAFGSSAHILGDEEFLPFNETSLDLVISNLALHSVNDLPGALLQIRKSLKPDGLFIAALAGGETLHELRDCLMHAELELKGGISPRVFPFADKQQMGALLQRAGFALPVVDSDLVTVTYDTLFNLMHDLRGMGESNIIAERSRVNPGKALFMKAAEHYAQAYAEDDGRIKASFEIIFLIGWAPHESQQLPLKPGSAQMRLAEALGTKENAP